MSLANSSLEEIHLADPYRHVAQELKVHLTFAVPEQDKLYIQSVCPGRGILQVMANLFFKSVVDETKSKGLTYNDYDQFIAIVRRRTAPWIVEKGHVTNEHGGTPSTRDPNSESSLKQPSSKSKHVKP